MEDRDRRQNLRFIGFPSQPNENCGQIVTDFCKYIGVDRITINRVHRISRMPNAVIVANFTFDGDVQRILQAARARGRNERQFVTADFSGETVNIRRKLIPHLETAKREGKRATIIRDHLLVDGKRWVFNKDGIIIELKPPTFGHLVPDGHRMQ